MKVDVSLKNARKFEDMSDQELHDEFQSILNDPRLKRVAEGIVELATKIKLSISQTYTEIWRQFSQPGNVAFDLHCIQRQIRGVSDEQRVQAAERIVLKLSYLIDRHRWHWVVEALSKQDVVPKDHVRDRARN